MLVVTRAGPLQAWSQRELATVVAFHLCLTIPGY